METSDLKTFAKLAGLIGLVVSPIAALVYMPLLLNASYETFKLAMDLLFELMFPVL